LKTDAFGGAKVMYPTYLPASGWCYPLPGLEAGLQPCNIRGYVWKQNVPPLYLPLTQGEKPVPLLI